MPAPANGNKASKRSDESETGLQSKGWRLPAHEIEQLVLNQLAAFLSNRGAVLDALPSRKESPDLVSAALTRAAKLAEACEVGPLPSQVKVVTALVRRITIAQDRLTIEIERTALAACLLDQEAAPVPEVKSRGTITLEVPVRLRRRGIEAKLVVQDRGGSASKPDPNLVKALARAHDWFDQIVRGEADGVGAIARRERLDRAYVTRVMSLAFLPPDITKAMLEGRQLMELTSKRLIRSILKVPLLWSDQTLALESAR